jgi:phosphohistidine phosphatase
MAIYLAQHGKSYSKEEDPERNLTHEGIAEVGYISEVIKDKGIFVSCIKHSGKKRAKQTAEIFKSILNPERGIEEIDGICPNDPVKPFAEKLKFEQFVMFVGHLPFLEKLISQLINGNPEKPVLKMQNGGVVCLDFDEDNDCWFIKWTSYPHIS